MQNNKLSQMVRVEENDRCPVPKDGFISDYQEKLLRYEKCYKGKLFDDENRCYEWGQRYDPVSQSPIPRELWKPSYMPQIGRELIDTQTAHLVGKDKFPSIKVTSSKPLFKNLPTPEAKEGDKSTPEERQAHAQAKALQIWADQVFELAKLSQVAQETVRCGLIRGEEPMLLRIHGKKPRLTSRNRTWCNWQFGDSNPDDLIGYREAYFFKRKMPDQQGVIKDKWFLFVREIDQKQWLEREFPIEVDANGKETFGAALILRQDAHGLGFVPVSVYSTPDRCSMYDNGVMENVKQHIEGYNDRRAGTLKNMQPQWVVLKENSGAPQPIGKPGDKKGALKPGLLWELEGKSVQSFSNQIEGYVAAGEMLDSEHQDMRAAGGIIDIPPDNEQSGRALILRLAPQFSSTDMLRTSFGEGLKDTARKTLAASHKYRTAVEFEPDLAIPDSLDGIVISLDWGGMLPVTPEVVSDELDNVQKARDMGVMSRQTAQEYLLPLFNVEDIAAERTRLAAEAAEEMEQQLQLSTALFEKTNGDQENEKDEDEDDGSSDFT